MVEKESLNGMEVSVFKTNAATEGIAALFLLELRTIWPDSLISLDMEDEDRVLRIEMKEFDRDKMLAIAERVGVDCQELTW